MSAPMSREAALRIALAARALPGIEAPALARSLSEKLELPLSEIKLGRITVEDLRDVISGEDGACLPESMNEPLKSAVRLLWGQGVEGSRLPALEAYTDGDMPGSLRVAVASNTAEQLDGHFGSCERFLVYQVSPTEIRLIDQRPTLEADAADDRNATRAALIRDCQIAYLQSIGGPAAAKLVRAGVHPVKVPAGGDARAALSELQLRLSSPPPWLSRIMGIPAHSLARFSRDENEPDWEEEA